MTKSPVCVEELEATREDLIAAMVDAMPESHRRFLLSFKRGKPDRALLGILAASNLPAVQWRRQNLDRLSSENRQKLIGNLETVLFPTRV